MNDSTLEAQTLIKSVAVRATTLMDIAEYAGVSKAAASVVLNNSRSGVRVSDATRQRIIEAARELQYQPNALARSLRRQKTNIIGFHSERGQLFNPLYPFYGTVLKGLLEGCEDYEKNFLIHGTFDKRSEDDIFQELLNGQIDGLVLYARETTPLIERLIASRLPVVTVADEVPGLPCVTVDDEQGGRLLARYLGQKNYKSVFYRVTDTVLPSTIERRLKGFREEARRHGMSVELFYSDPYDNEDYAAERELLLSKRRPQVIAAYNDFSADFLVALCDEYGIRVPDEVAITGFDGFASTMRPAPDLTTVRAPWDEVARRAVSLLVAQCNGETVPMRTEIPVELIVGKTA